MLDARIFTCGIIYNSKNSLLLNIIHILNFYFIIILAALGLCCFSPPVANGGSSPAAMCGLLIAVASLTAEQRLWGVHTSVVVA